MKIEYFYDIYPQSQEATNYSKDRSQLRTVFLLVPYFMAAVLPFIFIDAIIELFKTFNIRELFTSAALTTITPFYMFLHFPLYDYYTKLGVQKILIAEVVPKEDADLTKAIYKKSKPALRKELCASAKKFVFYTINIYIFVFGLIFTVYPIFRLINGVANTVVGAVALAFFSLVLAAGSFLLMLAKPDL